MHENKRKLILDTSQTFGDWRVALNPRFEAFDLRHFISKSYETTLTETEKEKVHIKTLLFCAKCS